MLTEAKVILCKWHRKFQVVVGRGNLFFKLHKVTKYHNRKTYLYLYTDIYISVFLSVSSRKKRLVRALGYLSLLLDFTYSVGLNFHILKKKKKRKAPFWFEFANSSASHSCNAHCPLRSWDLEMRGWGMGGRIPCESVSSCTRPRHCPLSGSSARPAVRGWEKG